MRTQLAGLVFVAASVARHAAAQNSLPIFQYKAAHVSYTLVGDDPARDRTTTIAVRVVPVALSFSTGTLDATPDVLAVKQSPVFTPFPFPSGTAQYADALLRATFPNAKNWHTVLSEPEVSETVTISVPPEAGYLLTSNKSGGRFAIVDIEFVQRELGRRIPRFPGKLVFAVTQNTAYYTEGDGTLCCSWGTHGLDQTTGNAFVLASYLDHPPVPVTERDVQPITQQLAEFILDPLHNPLLREDEDAHAPGNRFPPWMRPVSMRPGDQGPCGGMRVASAYFLLEPTDTNHKNNVPESKPFEAGSYHLQNVALLPWYLSALPHGSTAVSFPDPKALSGPAVPCPASRHHERHVQGRISSSIDVASAGGGHQLIGYWTGDEVRRLTDVSPQWDVIIVAFATPDKHSAGTLSFHPPDGYDPVQFAADIAALKRHGKTVMISLGGGGQYYSLDDPRRIDSFVTSVSAIIREYGFEGIDIDFESPSLVLAPGDTDFRHPTTPSIVNLIAGLRRLHDAFGPSFKVSLVPEGTQIPAGFATYGGQFGSYLPIAYALRDILTFMDTQDYNTPPLQGLDGEIYQAGTVDYHAAMTELVLHGFAVAHKPDELFPALAPKTIAVGFLTGETSPDIVSAAMRYIITGEAPRNARYRLLNEAGYSDMIGAMFWTIDDDRAAEGRFSNEVGHQLHALSRH